MILNYFPRYIAQRTLHINLKSIQPIKFTAANCLHFLCTGATGNDVDLDIARKSNIVHGKSFMITVVTNCINYINCTDST